MSAVVLTSENSQAFYERKLGIVPEPAAATEKPVEPAVESEKPVEAEAREAETDAQQTDSEKKQRLNARFSDLTKDRDEAKSRADAAEKERDEARKEAAEAKRRAAELASKYEPPKADPLGPKPKRDQFVSDAEHEAALEEWTTDKVTRDVAAREAQAKVERAWNERQSAFKVATPDYDAVLAASAELAVSNKVRDVILDSEQGPQILYTLAKDPQLVADLKLRGDDWALRKIGSLEAKFEGSKPAPAKEAKAPEAKPAAAATETSRAPAPISRLQPTETTPDTPIDDKGEFHGTYAQWKAGRKAKRIV